MTQSIFIYGPAGCGKTTNAEKLKKHYGLSHVIDDFWHGDRRKVPATGTLVIGQFSREAPKGIKAISYNEAAAAAKITLKGK